MKAFTLLEVLISVSILAIILTAIYSTYTSSVGVIQSARDAGVVNQTARIVFDRITKDLESAFITSEQPNEKIRLGMIGKDNVIEGRPADTLDFTALTHLAIAKTSPQTDLCEVGYYLEKDKENGGLILYRRDDGIPDEDLLTGGSTYELGRNIMGLDIKFYDAVGNEYKNWDTFEGNPSKDLPSLITIKLTIKGQEEKEHVFITTVHPVLAKKQED
jgi:general secretion pathway protein J